MYDPLVPRVPTVPAVRTRRAPLRSDRDRAVTPEVVEPEGDVIVEETIDVVRVRRRWRIPRKAVA